MNALATGVNTLGQVTNQNIDIATKWLSFGTPTPKQYL
jgi:hypothetical protein